MSLYYMQLNLMIYFIYNIFIYYIYDYDGLLTQFFLNKFSIRIKFLKEYVYLIISC